MQSGSPSPLITDLGGVSTGSNLLGGWLRVSKAEESANNLGSAMMCWNTEKQDAANKARDRDCWELNSLCSYLSSPLWEVVLVAADLPHVGGALAADVEANPQANVSINIKQVVEAAAKEPKYLH